MTEVEYSDLAVEQLEELEPPSAERIISKIEETEWTDHRLDSLTDSDYYKLRAGDHRAVIDWRKESETLFVVVVGHRSSIYDRYSDVI